MLSVRSIIVLVTTVLTGFSNPIWAAKNDIAWQREAFLRVESDLQKGRPSSYQSLDERLRSYALFPYLQYEYIRSRITAQTEGEVLQILKDYNDSLISNQLRNVWLYKLAADRRWTDFLTQYRDLGGQSLRCLRGQALFQLGQYEQAAQEARALWLTGESIPDECDRVFDAWQARGGLTKEDIWARMQLAMDKGQLSLVKQLAKTLPAADQTWVMRWLEVYKNPAENLHRRALYEDDPNARRVVRLGISRLAKRDINVALDVWDAVREQQLKDDKDSVADLDTELGLKAASTRHPRALELLSRVDKADDKVREWRIRAALGKQDWAAALQWIEVLPPADRERGQWKYWRARLLEMQTGEQPALKAVADRLYAEVARDRDYHGFLAADRLGKRYDMRSPPVGYTEKQLDDFAKHGAMSRVSELFALGRESEARREWTFATSRLPPKDAELALVLASRWGWHDRAILAAAKIDGYDDLNVRFPTLFKDVVLSQADEQAIDPAWVYGVIRQESVFMTDARSHAGALGLMQLMPATGRITAKQLKEKIRSNHDLLNVRQNIRLGTAYLRRMLDHSEGNAVLATASYNAGPGRVKQWTRSNGNGLEIVPADLWVETIPFQETRTYVRRVMAYTVIYNHRLGGEGRSLTDRMPDIALRDD